MKPESILHANLLDIIFDNRNKLYGAYELRNNYGGRLYSSLAIILFLMIVFSIVCLSNKHSSEMVERIFETEVRTISAVMEKPKEIPPVQPPTEKAKNGDNYSRIQIVDSLQPVDPIKHPDSSGAGIGPLMTGTSGEPAEGPAGSPDTSITHTIYAPPLKKPTDPNIPVDIVDVWPEYPGGMDALAKFFKRNLRSPDDLTEGQAVSVYVKFIVGYDGVLKNFEITKDGGEAFNKEVLRVLKKMGPWKPGISKGEKVSVYFTIPVKFVPQD